MADKTPPADMEKVRTYPLASRANKVTVDQFASPVDPDGSLDDFLGNLGSVLAAETLRDLAGAIVDAREAGCPVYLAMGAHVIKVGLSPVLIRLMEEGILTGLVFNGACAIHDWEVAAIGATSEDVAAVLHHGDFGMAEETGREINGAASEAAATGSGFGETLGRRIVEAGLPHREHSLLGRAWELGIPVTVHVAVGCDIVHQHPSVDGSAIGQATYTDFRKLVTLVSRLSGGVWINCGSAVQLPEVFLKALSVAENLGHEIEGLVTANMDMIRHYRTEENVLRRPTLGKGRGYSLIGHHELNIPLLAAAVGAERKRRR
jgi:hypothetical protein